MQTYRFRNPHLAVLAACAASVGAVMLADEKKDAPVVANAPAPSGVGAPAPAVKAPTPASTAAPTAPLLNAMVPQVNTNQEEVQATDKHTRPGGAYIVRGRWVDANGVPISAEEQAEYKLANLNTPDEVPSIQPGAGQVDPAVDDRLSTKA